MTKDQNILSIIRGDKLKFTTPDLPIKHFANNSFLDKEDLENIRHEIEKLLKKKVLVKTNHEKIEFISPIFVKPKDDGGTRMILNLKSLNQNIEFQHFKMQTIKDALLMISKGDYLTSIDLKDAYYSVPIHRDYQCFLKFSFQGTIYKFTCYPNGLGPCPRKFTKLTAVPMSKLRTLGIPICGFIDDFLLAKNKFIDCMQSTLKSAQMFTKIGFVIHPEKSQLTPSQRITYLGFVIDSTKMTITLTEKRTNALKRHLNILHSLSEPTIRYVAKVIGHIISALPASKYGALHYRNLEKEKIKALKQNCGNFDAKMTLSDLSKQDLKWWIQNINKIENWIQPPPIQKKLFTDSSDFAWGIIFEKHRVGGSWHYEELGLHINVKEMIAILFALKTFSENLKDNHICIYCDNTTAIGIINKMGSCKSNTCNKVCQEIWSICKTNNIWVTCTYIPGKENIEADEESRKDYSDSNWMINDKIFADICKKLNYPPKTDCFANRINNKTDNYISYRPDPNAQHINAFTINWSTLKNPYFFPPFSLVGKVLQKLKTDQCQGLIVTPDWPTQTWYTTLTSMTVSETITITPGQQVLVLPEDPQRLHPLWRKLKLRACIVSGLNT